MSLLFRSALRRFTLAIGLLVVPAFPSLSQLSRRLRRQHPSLLPIPACMPRLRGATSQRSRSALPRGREQGSGGARVSARRCMSRSIKSSSAARALIPPRRRSQQARYQHFDIVTIAAVANRRPGLKLWLGGGKATNITSRYDGTALIAAQRQRFR